MKRLDRYLLAETSGPLALGFAVFTFIMLIRFLFRSAEMIIRRGLSVSEVLELVALTLPNIVVLTIPMALLFAILIAIGRLAADSELTAMRACGISLFTLYRPILLLSLVLTAGNTFLTAYVLPRANHALQKQQLEIIAKTASRQVEPRVFYEEWEGYLLYVFDIPPGGSQWSGVFLAPSSPLGEHALTVAERGRLQVDETGEQIVLVLDNAVTHKMNSHKPGDYDVARSKRLEVVLEDEFTSSNLARVSPSKSVRELTLSELVLWVGDEAKLPELRRLAEVEIHKKFSIPTACLVFGLFALPLGFNNRRGGKSSGFALSILVIMAYYILLSNGEDAARLGKMAPWLSMWLPNIVFTVLGAFLLARRNRDKSLILSRLDYWIRLVLVGYVSKFRRYVTLQRRRRKEARKRARAGRSPDVVVRLPRFSLRFPNILDRYVITLFFRVFVIVMAAGLSLYVVADFTETIDDVLEHRPPLSVLVEYYAFMSLQIFFEIAPILVLVTTLLTFSLLSRTNEVTACKALGISLFRLAVPVLAAASIVSLAGAGLQAEVLPASNQRVAQLNDRIKGRTAARSYRPDRHWAFGEGRYIFNYRAFDQDREVMYDLQVFEFDDQYQIDRRLFVSTASYRDERWIMHDGWARTFDGARVTGFRRLAQPAISPYVEPPGYFTSEVKQPEQMHYAELEEYIADLVRRGQKVPELEVELHNKIAFPALSLVMALVALPFAFRLGRRGALYGVGLSLVLGMVLLGVFAFFSTLGEIGALPPPIAVWAPGLIFASVSMYLFLGVRT